MCLGPFPIIRPYFIRMNLEGDQKHRTVRLLCVCFVCVRVRARSCVLFFSFAKGAPQLYFVLLKKGERPGPGGMETPKVMILATMETFGFMDLGGEEEGEKETGEIRERMKRKVNSSCVSSR